MHFWADLAPVQRDLSLNSGLKSLRLKGLNELKRLLPITLLLMCLPGAVLHAQSLKGSSAVMKRQNQMAVSYGYSFLKTPQEVRTFVDNGYLVKITDSSTMTIHNVSYPYARPEVKLFLERLSRQYANACGEKMVVTSLTRPINKQPGNASEASVHPTGMALDLRIPRKSSCRSWLQKTLLSLEKSDVLDVTRERYPPHFHVALFTKSYEQYVAELESKQREAVPAAPKGPFDYKVRHGDSLYLIAQRNDTTVEALRSANSLRSNTLQIGQLLTIPGAGSAPLQAAQPLQVAAAPAQPEPAEQQDAARATPRLPQDYTVRPGDSLYLIAERNDTTIQALRAANNLRSNTLQIGQVLNIPGNGVIPAPVFVGPTMDQIAAYEVPAVAEPIAKEQPVAQPAPAQVAAVDNPLMDALGALERHMNNVSENYTVRSGDSLYLIAERHDITIEALRVANNLRSSMLKPGQVLSIPVLTEKVTEKAAQALASMSTSVFVGPTLEQVTAAVAQAVKEEPLPDLLDDATRLSEQQADENTDQQQQIYTVRTGDSLYLIAERNNTTIEALRAANNLRSIMLQPGQELIIPADADTLLAMTSAPELTHRVRRGDTLWDIATLYRTSISKLRAMNGLASDSLQVGQVLKVSGN